MSELPNGRWFDPRLSIGNVITIGTLLVTVTAGWFTFANRVSLLEAAQTRTEAIVQRLDSERDDIKTRVIRIEEKMNLQQDTLERILRNVESRDWQPPARP